ncbi:hypothetical protein BDK51DRAFT_35328 [Blyttiomyces helicus]|uniref:Serine-threonine/tyrosine-protein kinase catalytic domain-containing protein n=1 Tax=Blyttiomyces helicus TaxID=388810 RepID=A0A4P9VXW7_9FUNG|nr:hypothetical protein BDK51DRAFT_35328 [Blyttiomyces helicus]|eukprot:RKO83785.1 hypothetical protein BDK51DRAFT_35328 [Blyttiomyces helicus]
MAPYQFKAALLSGGRPSRPDDLPDGLWEIVEDCWIQERQERPTFGKVVARLSRFIEVPGRETENESVRFTPTEGFESAMRYQIICRRTCGVERSSSSANRFQDSLSEGIGGMRVASKHWSQRIPLSLAISEAFRPIKGVAAASTTTRESDLRSVVSQIGCRSQASADTIVPAAVVTVLAAIFRSHQACTEFTMLEVVFLQVDPKWRTAESGHVSASGVKELASYWPAPPGSLLMNHITAPSRTLPRKNNYKKSRELSPNIHLV